MTHQVYKDMLDVMKKRGGAYSGMDIPEFCASRLQGAQGSD